MHPINPLASSSSHPIILPSSDQGEPLLKQPLLDPLTHEKERLKRLPKHLPGLTLNTFALITGDSFLSPAKKLPTDLVDPNLDSKSFGILAGDAFVMGTGYEGQTIEEQIAYWKTCWKRWQSPSYLGPCNPHMHQEILNEITDNLEDFEKICRHFQNSDPTTIRTAIVENLKKKGHCFIPLRTHQAKDGQGHVFACVLEKDKEGKLTATILNVGAGAELHPIIEVDSHVKRSFMFPPIEFNNSSFFEDQPELAEHLIELLNDYSSKEPETAHHVTEIYHLFLGLGIVSDKELPKETGSLLQRSGTCPAEAMKSTHRYYFLKKLDLAAYKKVIFCIKFQSYYDIYCKLSQHPETFSEKDRALVKRSICQFASTIEKHITLSPKIIDDQMLLSAQALLDLIREELAKENPVSSKELDLSTPGNTLYPLIIPEVDHGPEKKNRLNILYSPKKLDLAAPDPKGLLEHFKTIQSYDSCFFTHYDIEEFKKGGRIEAFESQAMGYIEFIRHLPIPKFQGEDTYWDAVPADDRIKIMRELEEMTSNISLYLANIPYKEQINAQACMVQLAALAIQHRLASRNQAMHLEGCGYPILTEKLNKFHYFLTGSDQLYFRELLNYFDPAEKRLTLFDLYPPFGNRVKLEDNDSLCQEHSDCMNGLGGHLRYMDLLFPSNFPKKSSLYFLAMRNKMLHGDETLSKETKEQFKQFCSRIPDEYYLLQFSVFRTMKYFNHVEEGSGLTPVNYSCSDYQAYSDPFKIDISYQASIILPEKKRGTQVCDGSDQLAPFMKKSYFQAVHKAIPQENEAVVSSIKEKSGNAINESAALTPAIRTELLKILNHPELRASQVMQFCANFPQLCEDRNVKFVIRYAFLNDTTLIEKIVNEPGYAGILRQFFDHMIAETQWNSTIEMALFWIQTAALVETHIAEATGKETPREYLRHLISLCQQQQKSIDSSSENQALRPALHMTFALVCGLDKKQWDLESESDIIEAFLHSYLFNHLYQEGAGIDKQLLFLMKRSFVLHFEEVKNYVEKHGLEAYKPVLMQIGIEAAAKDDSLKNSWPTLSFVNPLGKKIEVNFPLISVDDDIIEYGEWPAKISNNATVAMLLQNTFPPVMKKGKDKVIARDGSFEITLNDNGLTFKKIFRINCKDLELTYLPKGNLTVKGIPQSLLNECECWIDPDHRIWLIVKNNVKPIALILPDHENKKALIQKVTREGKPLENSFLLQISQKSQMAAAFSILEENSEEIIAWGTKDGTISDVHFPRLDLTFQVEEVEENQKCSYSKNSAFVITTNQEIPNPFNTAIYLENRDTPEKKGMILPFQVILNEGFGSDSKNATSQVIADEHFFFELDVKSGRWRSSSQLAMLYLIYTLKKHGRHQEAAEYLNEFHPSACFDEKEVKLLIEILKDNHEARDLSIAVKAYLAYIQSNLVGRLSASDESKFDENIDAMEKLCMTNLDRLVELMGDQLNSNRFNYSPTVFELLEIDRELRLNREVIEKVNRYYSNRSKEPLAHWKRFLVRNQERTSELLSKGVPRSSLEKNLSSIANFTEEFQKKGHREFEEVIDQKFISIENIPQSFSFPNLVNQNKSSLKQIAKHYINLISYKKLSENQRANLLLDLQIILERSQTDLYANKLYLTILYLALQLPGELYQLVQAERYPSNALIKFMKSDKVRLLTSQMIENLEAGKSASSIVQSPFYPEEIKKTPARAIPIDFQAWKTQKDEYRKPLKNIQEDYFVFSEQPIRELSAEFGLTATENESREVKMKIEGLALAFKDKVPKSYASHQYKPTHTLEECSASLKDLISNQEKKIKGIRKSIETTLNYPSQEELATLPPEQQQKIYAHRNRILQGKIASPNFQQHLLPAVLENNPAHLREINPFLSDEQISELYHLTIEHMLASSCIDQAKEAQYFVNQAIAKPEKAGILLQQAGVVLAKERRYNPYQYPEMLIYEYATGNMLRNQPDQARLLKRIIKALFGSKQINQQELNRLFFEFQAGGGKTKVLSVILAAKAQKEGYSVLFFSLPSLLDIAKEDLKESLQLVYQQGIIPLEVPLNRELTQRDLGIILQLLKQKKGCIVTNPESWHALHLAYQDAILGRHKELLPLLENIMTHFREESYFFIDEEHRNVSSLVEANRATGTPKAYPEEQSKLICLAYDALYGWIENPLRLSDGSALHEKLGLADNRQATLSDTAKKEIPQRLADYLFEVLKLPQEHKSSLMPYLTKKDELAPRHCPINDWRTIDFARGLICEILPYTLSQKHMISYGPSPNPNDFVFDPYILGEPAGPKFQDPDIAAALTVQGLRQQGLNTRQMQSYLLFMKSKLRDAQDKGKDQVTDFLRVFQSLHPPAEFPLEKMSDKSLNNPLVLQAYAQAIGKHPQVIKVFEEEIALKKIKIYPTKLVSSSQELSIGARAVIHTSATLGTREENPYLEPNGLFLTTEEFMADVIDRALLPHNQECHWVEESNPSHVFEALLKSGTDFRRIDGIINVGGLCTEASAANWAKALIDFNQRHQLDYAGAIIGKNELVNGKIEKRLYIIQPNMDEILIEGSDVKKALEKHGLMNKRFFKIYPPEMTTGTDMYLANDARMLITLGENVSLSAMVQAIMRERGFLLNPINPDTSQGLIWVGSTKIQKMLEEKYGAATPRHALLFAAQNEITQEKEAIKMRAIQDIEMIIRKLAKEELKKIRSSPLKRCFEIPLSHNPTVKYGSKISTMETDRFLLKHARQFAAQAGINLNAYPEVVQRINDAIAEAAKKIAEVEVGTQHNFNAAMYQQQEIQQDQNVTQRTQQQQRQLKTDIGGSLAAPEEDYADTDLRIGSETILNLSAKCQANQILGIDWLSPNLYFLDNYTNTITQSKSEKNAKAPTFMMGLLNKESGKREYRIISVEDAFKYTQQLQDKDRLPSNHTAVIFTANGALHQSDRAEGGLSDKEIKDWQQSDEFRQIVAEIGLLSGIKIEAERQKKLIEGNPKRVQELKRIIEKQLFYDDQPFQQKWSSLLETVFH